mmetsp:Transcript_22096/g.46002  ORF Transcript_22096/g.46002 Transcript_22096/m.46002 type:complete len:139 (-) Transcript_22096:22-438(-)
MADFMTRMRQDELRRRRSRNYNERMKNPEFRKRQAATTKDRRPEATKRADFLIRTNSDSSNFSSTPRSSREERDRACTPRVSARRMRAATVMQEKLPKPLSAGKLSKQPVVVQHKAKKLNETWQKDREWGPLGGGFGF